jgi:hypothetical protein
MGHTGFCDRCNAVYYSTPTLRLDPISTGTRGLFVDSATDGTTVFDLCEACAVDLRAWVQEGSNIERGPREGASFV